MLAGRATQLDVEEASIWRDVILLPNPISMADPGLEEEVIILVQDSASAEYISNIG